MTSLLKCIRTGVSLDLSSSEGFEWLYRTYWKKVFAVCYHSTEDAELAKEMTQDIYQSIWERRHSLKIHGSYEHYLVRAAKQLVSKHFRRKAIHGRYVDYAKHATLSTGMSTEDDFNYAILAEKLDQVIEKLPKQCQNVFTLSRTQGLTNKRIAQQLGISERAVEYHISKALSRIKQQLPEYELD